MRSSILRVDELGEPGALTAETVTLNYQQRRLPEQQARLPDGTEIRISLPPKTVLYDGDRLRTSAGRIIMVRAAAEMVSVGICLSPVRFARARYLLGIRQTTVEIQRGRVMYQIDRSLDQQLRNMRLTVMHEIRVFEPGAMGDCWRPHEPRRSGK